MATTRTLPARAALSAVAVLALSAVPLAAQVVIDLEEELELDRPEAWAMAWFASVAQLSPLSGPQRLEPGAVEVALEGGWVPSLSEEERRVGFIGTKAENLNRASVFGRLRLAAGLPGRLVATAGWVPPAEVDGITPEVYSLALERRLATGASWSLGLRLAGETGSFRGDLTCDHEAVAAGDDPLRNPYGCEVESDDEMEHVWLGGGLLASWLPPASRRLEVHAGISWNHLDADLQVDARYRGFVDRTLLVTSGSAWSGTLGAAWHFGSVRLAAEAFYSPLEVERTPGSTRTDELFNVRALVAYRIR